jgi:histidine triad (HIT) family protein
MGADYFEKIGTSEMQETLFTKIIERKIPAKIVYEDQAYIAIEDIDPQAPVHLLVIPKRVIRSLNELKEGDEELIGGMFRVAQSLMMRKGLSDYRTVFNCGEQAGQTVWHLHLHVLAGREMHWPPG